MLDSTRKARAEAFALRKDRKFEEALAVLRPAWAIEKDPVSRALLKLDAAFANVGLKQYEKAAHLLEGTAETSGLGEKPKASALQLAAHVKSKKAAASLRAPANPAAKKPSKRKWKGASESKSRIRVISKRYVPSKYKPASRPGWRKDVGY